MLTPYDVARFDAIMAAVMKKREDRGFMVPERNEERIAEILRDGDRRAAEEHALLLQEKNQMASYLQFLEDTLDLY